MADPRLAEGASIMHRMTGPILRRVLIALCVTCAGAVFLGPAAFVWAATAEPERQKDPKDQKDSGEWRPLFDGKTLNGWHPIGQGRWTVEDGMIVGRHDKTQDYGHLITDKSYKDFT